jgi:hypothetical protein
MLPVLACTPHSHLHARSTRSGPISVNDLSMLLVVLITVEGIELHDTASIEGNAVQKSVLSIHKGRPFMIPLNLITNECCEGGRLCHGLFIIMSQCECSSTVPGGRYRRRPPVHCLLCLSLVSILLKSGAKAAFFNHSQSLKKRRLSPPPPPPNQ